MSQILADIIYDRNRQFQLGSRISTALEYLKFIELPIGAKISNRPEKGCLGVDYILIKYCKFNSSIKLREKFLGL